MAETKEPIVAIDGPSGAGKSTVSKAVARALQYAYVDTGALYRSVAVAATGKGIAFDDDNALEALMPQINIRFQMDGEVNRVFLDDKEITTAIRTPEISMGASAVSARPPVRAGLLDLQRRLGENGGVVLEGRDIGTVVFPNAKAKIFLTASNLVRAQRRFDELQAKGTETTLEEVLQKIEERDHADSTRAEAPLKKADDATEVDTSTLGIEQVVEKIVALVKAAKD